MGWGLATVCGVAGRGETLDVVPRFLITGRRVAGTSFGGQYLWAEGMIGNGGWPPSPERRSRHRSHLLDA
jgi:hypothetical protein